MKNITPLAKSNHLFICASNYPSEKQINSNYPSEKQIMNVSKPLLLEQK